MFRRLTIAKMKYLVSSYTGLLCAVYSGTVQEVSWARDLLCVMEVGRCGYVGFPLLYDMSNLCG